MKSEELAQLCYDTLNRLTKWRAFFAGWQLGTRLKGDAECDAVRDHREATILLRAESSALTALLLRKGIFSEDEYRQAVIDEAEMLDKDYARRFPGATSTDTGMQYDQRAAETMRNWLF